MSSSKGGDYVGPGGWLKMYGSGIKGPPVMEKSSKRSYDEAVAAYEAFRDRAPNSVNPLGYLAIAYVDAGRIEEARAKLQAERAG